MVQQVGKTANWMGPLDKKHSFTYTPDAGKATAILGNDDTAYGQVWHLPTAPNPLTGQGWVEAIAQHFNTPPKVRANGRFIIKFLGLFVPIMREMPEMTYQYDRDYVCNSSKFEKKYSFTPTSYSEGIKQMLEIDYKS